MKKFVEKLIGRLEKLKIYYAEDFSQGYSCEIDCVEKYEVKKIINQLAEEYKNTNIITDFLRYARDNADIYDTNEGWSLADLIDLSIKYSDEYINTSTDTSSGWVACSERLPEETNDYLVTWRDRATCKNYVEITEYDADSQEWLDCICQAGLLGYDIIAWQSLPAPYKEGVTENERNSRV